MRSGVKRNASTRRRLLKSPRVIRWIELFGDTEIVPRTSSHNFSDRSVGNQLLGHDNFGPVLSILGQHENAITVSSSSGQNSLACLEGRSHWLF